jgi:hypothetical protein
MRTCIRDLHRVLPRAALPWNELNGNTHDAFELNQFVFNLPLFAPPPLQLASLISVTDQHH